MKKLLMVLAVLIAAFLVYKIFIKKDKPPREKPVPIAVSKHSDVFNHSMEALLAAYYVMTDGFVNWDSAAVGKGAQSLQTALADFKVEELKKDSAIYQTAQFPLETAKTSTAAILGSPDWTAKRHALNDLSDALRMLLLTVKYDQAPAYWQECPMAFGEGQPGNWLSGKNEVVNPYLGNKDPRHGNTMLHCGENKMVIDFTKSDSTQTK
ncbi:hypothetical protein LL912_04725 [Niabella sp. CC-SYL272]|uniref:hypothetical protein n=1 Tax=Niabella agricola TaxID=2891571 RepID=UPI001F1FE615|nr:hypothetical protein [Niabella agricola]MCF3108075.1 hypothetical protein [Niabella agricola]